MRSDRFWIWVSGLTIGLALVFVPAWAGGNGQSKVAPPTAVVGGKTYGEWSAAWWQWALSLPYNDGTHPFYASEDDFDGTLGQSGKVWFLAGVFGEDIHRSITIPAGTRLFVAIINAEASSVEADPFYGATEGEQAAAASAFVDYVENPYLEVDGEALSDIEEYRFLSPQFSFTMDPYDNVLFVEASEGTSVSDGYWAMIGPLSKGEHTIYLSGQFVDTPFGTFGVETTYHVTVE